MPNVILIVVPRNRLVHECTSFGVAIIISKRILTPSISDEIMFNEESIYVRPNREANTVYIKAMYDQEDLYCRLLNSS